MNHSPPAPELGGSRLFDWLLPFPPVSRRLKGDSPGAPLVNASATRAGRNLAGSGAWRRLPAQPGTELIQLPAPTSGREFRDAPTNSFLIQLLIAQSAPSWLVLQASRQANRNLIQSTGGAGQVISWRCSTFLSVANVPLARASDFFSRLSNAEIELQETERIYWL